MPTADDAAALGIRRGRLAWTREVVLSCDDEPLVFAHSVLPRRPRGPLHDWLRKLGGRSLGARIFSQPGFRRGRIQCRRIERRQSLYATTAIWVASPNGPPPSAFWARRSRFDFGRQSVLVNEVFSPRVAKAGRPNPIPL